MKRERCSAFGCKERVRAYFAVAVDAELAPVCNFAVYGLCGTHLTRGIWPWPHLPVRYWLGWAQA